MGCFFVCFFHFLILLFYLPNIDCSCPNHLPCGNIEIQYPFSPYVKDSNDSDCTAPYKIYCEGSTPTITVTAHNTQLKFAVKEISYTDQTLTIRDQALVYSLNGSHCSFLFNYSKPVPHFYFFLPDEFQSLNHSMFDCNWDEDVIRQIFSSGTYHATLGKDFNIYYWNESQDRAHAPNCWPHDPAPAVEWRLSFSGGGEEENDGFSMLSVGFSHQLELRPDCFDNQVGTENTTSIRSKEGTPSTRRKIVIGSTGIACFLLVSLLFFLYLCRTKKICSGNFLSRKNKDQNVDAFLETYMSLFPKRYKYSYVKRITNSFHYKLGQGGFGTVYKGTVEDGRLVAVKVLRDCKGSGEEFLNEVASIGMTSHVNVVSLLGFCSEGSKRALVYDFMCNGSLEKFIYSDTAKTTLGWEKLYQITIGIARGLEYLHRGCNTRIVHFDIKPHNILLDQDFCPKISDFGLARLCSQKDSILSMAGTRGTIGYIAPEVFSRNFGAVSSKSDVYSYGIMVLEIVGGRKNINAGAENTSENYFPHWVHDHFDQDGCLQSYGVTNESEEIARKMILVGLWCIQTMPQNRPSMGRVIDMLEGRIDELEIPPKPYLSTPLRSFMDTSSI